MNRVINNILTNNLSNNSNESNQIIVQKYNGIAVYKDNITNLDDLSKEELIFIYLMKKALDPLYKIYRNQQHRYTNEIIKLFKNLYYLTCDDNTRISKEIKYFYIFLITKNSIYVGKSHKKIKFSYLGLNEITKEILIEYIDRLNISNRRKAIVLVDFLFSDEDNIGLVDNSITKSRSNYYGPSITDEDYNKINMKYKTKNSYFDKKDNKIIIHKYSVNDKYSSELKESVYWLQKAYDHVNLHIDCFDKPMLDSIYYMIRYFISGDENDFKEHSRHWIKINTRVQYTMGFIESYKDPKKIIGSAGGNIILKSKDIDSLKNVLLEIQNRLPFSTTNKENNKLLNVSICHILAIGGYYGPSRKTAAYCLPNDMDLISKYGSKQIIYDEQKSDHLYNVKLLKKFMIKKYIDFMNLYDKNNDFRHDFWNLLVLFHETIGHASFKLTKHVIVKEDLKNINHNLSLSNSKIADIIDLNEQIFNIFMTRDKDSLEELRSEIIGLYIMIYEVDLLEKNKLYKDWYKKLGREKMIEYYIISFLENSLKKLISQPYKFKDIHGAHARANIVILNYILSNKSVKLEKTKLIIDRKKHIIYNVAIIDLNKTIHFIKKLMIKVQNISSTADNVKNLNLFDKYIKYPLTIKKMNRIGHFLRKKYRKLSNGTTSLVRLLPKFIPLYDMFDNLIDVQIGYYDSIIEQEEDKS
jgi:hypothetical protein